MKKFLFITAFLLFPSLSYAGSITFSVTAAGLNASKSFTLADAEIARFADAMIIAYGPTVITTPAVTNPDGSVTPAVTRPMTRLEALNLWAIGTMEGTKNNVTRIESDNAVKALPPIVPIDPR